MNLEDIATKQDLEELKKELLEEIRKLRYPGKKSPIVKEWLKSYEVIEMLSISPNTLATMRKNGTIRYSKIGGLMYYKHADIESLMDSR